MEKDGADVDLAPAAVAMREYAQAGLDTFDMADHCELCAKCLMPSRVLCTRPPLKQPHTPGLWESGWREVQANLGCEGSLGLSTKLLCACGIVWQTSLLYNTRTVLPQMEVRS